MNFISLAVQAVNPLKLLVIRATGRPWDCEWVNWWSCLKQLSIKQFSSEKEGHSKMRWNVVVYLFVPWSAFFFSNSMAILDVTNKSHRLVLLREVPYLGSIFQLWPTNTLLTRWPVTERISECPRFVSPRTASYKCVHFLPPKPAQYISCPRYITSLLHSL